MTTIRPERPGENDTVETLVEAAFASPVEARLVVALRRGPHVVPDLSLVAERDGVVVGHAIFTEATVDGLPPESLLVLGPVAVRPDHQRRGVGTALIETGLADARDLGYRAVVLLGSTDYYPRFGFRPAAAFGLENPWDAPDPDFQAVELDPGALDQASGVVEPAPAFQDV